MHLEDVCEIRRRREYYSSSTQGINEEIKQIIKKKTEFYLKWFSNNDAEHRHAYI